MNVRLKKEFAFSTGLVFDGNYAINQYMMTLRMVTNTSDHREQNVAYERVKYWIHNVLDHSVFIQQDSELLPAFLATGQRVITVTEAPVDQIIGIMLYSKLNAIVEERLIITDIELQSVLGDGMIYLHNEHESVGPFANDGWWQDPRPVYNDVAQRARGNKVVTLGRSQEWKDLDLDWEENDEESNTVVFADFKRDETK